ncbi:MULTISPECIES: very short patch repair endonuclease [unclassified Devosia]|uniref:very short patch repair endonuclease n=1 Tax=unclassified Devosia TaxID=196773 RepID=UPI001ACC74D7|nr:MULTISPECIES: very short patch repair endonuclease [unclassified Devosia]MBN9304821.1 DNA mismatch endonuclease Vsr [Devosia sp.]
MADTLSPDRRSWNMSRITGKDTRPERQLRSILHRAGYRFRLHASSLPGRPDIVLPKYRTAIFVNGCFWHRHEGCSKAYTPSSRTEFWTTKFDATVARDAKKSAELRRLGWNVLTVWECELQKSPDSVIRQIRADLVEAVP